MTSAITRLSDSDLLGMLIGVEETRRRYQGSLTSLFARSPGQAPHERCVAAKELVRRMLNEELRRECVLTAPQAVRDFLKVHFYGQEYESFMCIWVDAQNRLIAAVEMFRGTLTQTSVYPREVVKEALQQNAAAVIFAHNHPSGIADPSKSDELLTHNLKQALALIDVKVLDHFIMAGSSVLSFAERGLI